MTTKLKTKGHFKRSFPLRAAIVVACSAVGTAIGYGLFLLVGLAELMWYGDDGQNGHPTSLVQNMLFFGIFGIATAIGCCVGLFIAKKSGTKMSQG